MGDLGYSADMRKRTLIPPSPAEDDYRARPSEIESDIGCGVDPMALFEDWLAEAVAREPADANAMTLATVGADGLPDARVVLLKDVDARGFVFYTNLESAKARQLAVQHNAALVFHWKSLRRSVRVRGQTAPVSEAEADVYFATRARSAQIGAWASEQSRPMPDDHALERRVAEAAIRFGLGAPPRPPFWSGFRLSPQSIEFWRSRPFRLHERQLFTREGGAWKRERLYP